MFCLYVIYFTLSEAFPSIYHYSFDNKKILLYSHKSLEGVKTVSDLLPYIVPCNSLFFRGLAIRSSNILDIKYCQLLIFLKK